VEAARINFDKHFCPANDVVFSIVFSDRNLFARLIHAVTGKDIKILGNVVTQATLREDDPLLESIRFDTFAESSGGVYYTADMQRSFDEAKQARRTIFYACRAISTQNVDDMAYEKLKPVSVSFVLTTHDQPRAIQRIGLYDADTKELYDDLFSITVVFVKSVIRNSAGISDDLYILSRYFALSSKNGAMQFAAELGETELGKELIRMYNNSTANVNRLYEIERRPYFQGRLTEAQLEEERVKARKEMAVDLYREDIPIDKIAHAAKVSVSQVKEWVDKLV
jgi:hypothetical protein